MNYMKINWFLLLVTLFLFSCNKDKFTTTPQISFRSLTPNFWLSSNFNYFNGPVLSIQLTDLEGDFGINPGKDTSFVYVKNITVPPYDLDSFRFPDLSEISNKKNLNIQVDAIINRVRCSAGTIFPLIDTIFFEVYVKDFAKNKSNVIQTGTPLYLLTQ